MKGIDYAVLGLVALLALAVGAFGFSTHDVKVVNTETTKLVTVQANSTAQEDAANLALKDENFKQVALALATDDLQAKAYKDLFNFLVDQNVSIAEKTDISKVVIKDSTVSNIDADNKDANVDLELKVYFEDLNGDTVKKYVNVSFVVNDGDIDDTEYSFA